MEAAGLGAFIVSACVFGVLLEHPGSPLRQVIADGFVRRTLMGLAMGATAIAIIYSPWGQQSGAHINPSTTLTFLRLGKVEPWDAFFYAAAQTAGGAAGVGLVALLLPEAVAHPSVHYVATVPGSAGVAVAFAAEVAISFGMMTLVLWVSNTPALSRSTGVLCGGLVALYISLEAPLSGMSMNPARTLASALAAGDFTSLWLYFTAPPLGMLAAAELYLRAFGGVGVHCAKLHHDNDKRCIFCGARIRAALRAATRSPSWRTTTTST